MRWLAVLLVVVPACTSGSSPDSRATESTTGPDASLEANGTIDHIVDGDTVDIDFDGRVERVRLIGIDTPETKKPNTPIQCFGPEATTHTTSLLPIGTPVRVERDIVGRDDYGRLLGYVYRAEDAVFVNLELVRQGFAQPLSIAPNTAHEPEFVGAARDAEREDLGLWSACRA